MELFWLGVFVAVSAMITLLGLIEVIGLAIRAFRKDKE